MLVATAAEADVPFAANESKDVKKKEKKRFKIAGMKINSLRSIAKHFGLGGKGKKSDLIERIEGAGVDLQEAAEVAGEQFPDSPERHRSADVVSHCLSIIQ